MKSVAVVTVTNGNRTPELIHCVNKLDVQTYPVMHYILCDGDFETFLRTRKRFESPTRRVCYWDAFIGGKDLEGRKWLAAAPMMVNEDITLFCNDDDWYKPDHVETIVDKIESGYDWAYSFRSIHDKEGHFLFDDNCEALGEASSAWNLPGHHFVDWCMWGMLTSKLRNISSILAEKGYGIDRQFYQLAKQVYPNFTGTNQHTFCFRLGGNAYSVQEQFFIEGNAFMRERYNNRLPWLKYE